MIYRVLYYAVVLGIPTILLAGIAWAMHRGDTPWLRR